MAYRGKVLIVCIWAIILHSHQYVFVYSVHCLCLWQFPEYCITGVPVWVHTEAESAVPSKVTEPVAEQAVSGNGNLRSRCLLAVSRLSPDLLSVRPHLRPHADFLCPPALSFYSEVHVEVPGKAAVYVSFFFFFLNTGTMSLERETRDGNGLEMSNELFMSESNWLERKRDVKLCN